MIADSLRKVKWVFHRSKAYHSFIRQEIKGYRDSISSIKMLKKRMALISHSLEKGAGIRNSRNGYGKEKAKKLIAVLDNYLYKKGETDCWEFIEAVNVLEFYLELSRNEPDISDLKKSYQMVREKYPDVNFHEHEFRAGFAELSASDLCLGDEDCSTLQKAILKRRTIRFFAKEDVDESLVQNILHLAQSAPSACNRQPIRVYYSMDQDKNHLVDECIPGSLSFRGEVPYFFIVTADRLAFNDDELFQWYVNGGIYIGYLTLAIHAYGLGSIVFQWPSVCPHEEKLRKTVCIPNDEIVVAIVGYGKIDKQVKCLEAERRKSGYSIPY